ncbi:MAG: hypothetical protein IKQ15_13755, partial [Kiritimatiellae bacterium]|nr:hypothetical protein [Kiritimatiellia bacterium]
MKDAKWLAGWLAVAAVAAFGLPRPAAADTQKVDGVTWTYTVSGGRAFVEGASPARGELAIPATLGGAPAREVFYQA